MNTERPFGLYLFTKSSRDHKVLKDLLQFVKSVSPGKGNSFSYIEAETSLHPHLSLLENLQLEAGISSFNDLKHLLKPEQIALVNLLKKPEIKSKDAEIWENFLVSLLKGLISSSQNLLIDMNEELLSPFLIQSFKRAVLNSTDTKSVYLASANSSLWLDCAHTLVGRKEYQFELQRLNADIIKKYWAA